jgi:hypothetical protein
MFERKSSCDWADACISSASLAHNSASHDGWHFEVEPAACEYPLVTPEVDASARVPFTLGDMRVAAAAFVLCIFEIQPAFADDPIPPGHGWFCYQVSNEYVASDRSGRCFRSLEDCTASREDWPDTVTATSTLTECRFQKNAAVVTYFDIMQDQRRAWPLPSSSLCEETRRYLAKSKDNKSISSCQLVGDRALPRAAFNAAAMPDGKNWYCTRDAKRLNACSRDEDECTQAAMGGSSCTKQDVAVAVTWDESATSDNFFEAVTRISASDIGVFRSKADCDIYVSKSSSVIAGLSQCTPIGAKEQPPNEALFPAGTGWYCFSDYVVPKDWSQDTCFRTEKKCEATRDEVSRQAATPGKCAKATTAFAYTDSANFFALRTLEECRRVARNSDSTSGCSAVRDIYRDGVDPPDEQEAEIPTVAVVPQFLDRPRISAGIANVKSRIASCGDSSPARGRVKVRVEVAPNGSVSDVRVEEAPNSTLGDCVKNVVQRATFAKTESGGNFSYPFVF